MNSVFLIPHDHCSWEFTAAEIAAYDLHKNKQVNIPTRGIEGITRLPPYQGAKDSCGDYLGESLFFKECSLASCHSSVWPSNCEYTGSINLVLVL